VRTVLLRVFSDLGKVATFAGWAEEGSVDKDDFIAIRIHQIGENILEVRMPQHLQNRTRLDKVARYRLDLRPVCKLGGCDQHHSFAPHASLTEAFWCRDLDSFEICNSIHQLQRAIIFVRHYKSQLGVCFQAKH
jgi:hypothetical protein